MKTTLNKIKQHSPCKDGWTKLLAFLNKTEADDEELSLLTILESNGLQDALWALRCVEGSDRDIRLMACDFAESVVHLTNDERSINAIKVSRDYANGLATLEELDTAGAAASDASCAAWAAACDAASTAASTAAWAAKAAAWASARAAAKAASDAAAWAAKAAAKAAAWAASDAAKDDAWADAWADAWDEEKKKQIEIFKNYCK
jgi:hypothetical protein